VQRISRHEHEAHAPADTGSQTRTAPDGAVGWTVVQRGPVRLWDAVEAAVLRRQEAGAPHQEASGFTVGAYGTQLVWLGAADGPGGGTCPV
jgi:hypothetical protein